jgi:16S rRNA (uracil1498-N3)-methyltransferase
MNLILFEKSELAAPLSPTDERARHIREVLRRRVGDSVDCGVVDGPRGKARVTRIDAEGLYLAFSWSAPPPPLDPIHLIVGLPRPPTARRILTDAATLGVAGLRFFPTEKGEPSYATSHLWAPGEVRRHLLLGTAQAFCTRVPECALVASLAVALADANLCPTRVALDNYEADTSVSSVPLAGTPVILAIGSERGWSPAERDMLREAGFGFAHLGPRVLRAETACVAGLAVLKSRLGLFPTPDSASALRPLQSGTKKQQVG